MLTIKSSIFLIILPVWHQTKTRCQIILVGACRFDIVELRSFISHSIICSAFLIVYINFTDFTEYLAICVVHAILNRRLQNNEFLRVAWLGQTLQILARHFERYELPIIVQIISNFFHKLLKMWQGFIILNHLASIFVGLLILTVEIEVLMM